MTQSVIALLQNADNCDMSLYRALLYQGYTVYPLFDLAATLMLIRQAHVDLLLIDVDTDTLNCEWCHDLRQVTAAPIVVRASVLLDDAVVLALDRGADLYLSRTTNNKVMLAYVATLLRRASTIQHSHGATPESRLTTYQDGRLSIDLSMRSVCVDGTRIELTPIEFSLLTCLVENADRTLTFEQILTQVWGWSGTQRGSLHTYISHLRRKLGDDSDPPHYIISTHGIGYRFCSQY